MKGTLLAIYLVLDPQRAVRIVTADPVVNLGIDARASALQRSLIICVMVANGQCRYLRTWADLTPKLAATPQSASILHPVRHLDPKQVQQCLQFPQREAARR